MTSTAARRLRLAAVLLPAALAACAVQHYEPAPLDPAGTQARWLAADTSDAALREALAHQGIDVSTWPLPAWNLDALSALALMRHPDLAVARAEVREAEVHRQAVAQRPAPGLDVGLEHHSADATSTSPWTVSLVIDTLLTGSARRAARADEADALLQEAMLHAAEAAWSVRQRVRTAHRALYFAHARAAQADALAALRAQLAASSRARLEHGAIDARIALTDERDAAEAARQAALAHGEAHRARQALASAVGLPGAAFDDLTIAFDGLDAAPPMLPPAILQRQALLNRVELRAALARYAAADAALRAELAHQWPELVLKPGYAWDQGDNVWSLGLGLSVPPGGRNQAPIEEARARRQTQGARVAALQVAALAALRAAQTSVLATRRQAEAAQAQLSSAQALGQRAERRLAAGDADRAEVLAARVVQSEAERQLIEARAARWAAQGAVEDVVQQPLDAAASHRHAAAADGSVAIGSVPSRNEGPR